jgi:O-antigen/teichoic acid export membrane protein
LYIPAVRILFGKSEFCAGWTPFIILAIGIFAASGLLPSSMLLIQTGRSGWQTIYMGAVLLTNILVNLAAIPFLGISGAALGAAAGFVCMALYLKIFTRKLTGVKI